jgi:hypothetical protein
MAKFITKHLLLFMLNNYSLKTDSINTNYTFNAFLFIS